MAYTLNFAGYDVLKMDFERIAPGVSKAPGTQIELTPAFAHKITKHSDGKYSLELGARVLQDDFPMRIEIVIRGNFDVRDADDPLRVMQINATAILLPYLRALFSMLTTLAGIQPISLPIINVVELFQRQATDKQE